MASGSGDESYGPFQPTEGTMTMETPKRKYKKLSPATWAEVRAVWEIGEATLEDLAMLSTT